MTRQANHTENLLFFFDEPLDEPLDRLLGDKMPDMTREERAQRRRDIAAEVADGAAVGEVARKYSVSVSMVANACQEHNVAPPKLARNGSTQQRLQIVAWLIGGYTGGEIAEDLGVSRQYVSQVRQQAKDAGVFEAVEKLGKAIPEPSQKLSNEVKFSVLVAIMTGEQTFQAIADEFGLHISTVFELSRVAREAGMEAFARRKFKHHG